MCACTMGVHVVVWKDLFGLGSWSFHSPRFYLDFRRQKGDSLQLGCVQGSLIYKLALVLKYFIGFFLL